MASREVSAPANLEVADASSEDSFRRSRRIMRAFARINVDRWGRASVDQGETLAIELSELAAKNSRVLVDRSLFREERLQVIRERIHEYKPEFVIMYGMNREDHWASIAVELSPDTVVKHGATLFALTPHSIAFGRTRSDWVRLGATLRELGNRKIEHAVRLRENDSQFKSRGQESSPRANLQPQFLPKGFALLEPFEKFFQDAHDDSVDADAFLFSPFPESGPSLGSDVKQLRRT